MTTYTIQAYFPVLRGCDERIEAESPAAAMAELKRRVVEDDWLAENNDGMDDSDGPDTYCVWDKAMRVQLLEETNDPQVALVATLADTLKYAEQELTALTLRYGMSAGQCLTQVRAALAKVAKARGGV